MLREPCRNVSDSGVQDRILKGRTEQRARRSSTLAQDVGGREPGSALPEKPREWDSPIPVSTVQRSAPQQPVQFEANAPDWSLQHDMRNPINPSTPEYARPFFYFSEKFSPPQNGEFFESQKDEHFHFSKNSPGETETLFCLKKSLNIAKMVEKRFELPTSTHDLSYEKVRPVGCRRILLPDFFSDKGENLHARVTGVHKFLTLTPPLVLVDNREASHQEMKPL